MNILTFDLEEWFTYAKRPNSNKEYYSPILKSYLFKLLDLLDQKKTKCTFFCLGVVAREEPEVIKSIYERGHEVGCHSYSHKWISKMNYKQFSEDTRISIDVLEQITGEKVRMYRAPAFSITENTKWALEVLIEQGILYDSSIFPVKRRFGGFPSYDTPCPATIKTQAGEIKEFPINYSTLGKIKIAFSGGGYFRFYPYWLIHYFTKKEKYTMTYFHLKDFDRFQKKHQKLSLKYFYNFYGIKSSYKKFERYLNDFSFLSIGDASAKIDWPSHPIVDINMFDSN